MEIINIAILVFLCVIQAYSLPNTISKDVSADLDKEIKNNIEVSPIPYTTIPDGTSIQPPPSSSTIKPAPSTESPTSSTVTPDSNITTIAPNTTTIAPNITTIAPNTTTISPNTTTIAPNTTTIPPKTTTITPNTTIAPNITTLPPITTYAPLTTILPPHSHTQKFDFPSFIGGIMLTLGLLAIGFVSHKFYKARTDRNYHTL